MLDTAPHVGNSRTHAKRRRRSLAYGGAASRRRLTRQTRSVLAAEISSTAIRAWRHEHPTPRGTRSRGRTGRVRCRLRRGLELREPRRSRRSERCRARAITRPRCAARSVRRTTNPTTRSRATAARCGPTARWAACCVEHDIDYWCGGDVPARARADAGLDALRARRARPPPRGPHVLGRAASAAFLAAVPVALGVLGLRACGATTIPGTP